MCGDAELKKYITKYCKNLFSQLDITPLSMDESRREDIPQVSEKENEGHKTFPKQKIKRQYLK